MSRIDLIKESEARVARITLESEEVSPRHYHTEVIENVVCLTGQIKVIGHVSDSGIILMAGQSCEIAPKAHHNIVNMRNSKSEYLLIQKGKYDFVPVHS